MARVTARLPLVVSTPLRRYRLMSYVAGTALLILVVVGVPLQASGVFSGLSEVLGVAHGVVLFPLYLATIAQLAFTARLRLWWWALMILGGVVPVLAFVMEHYVTKEMEAAIAMRLVEPGAKP